MVMLYHYTSSDGCFGIISEGFIRSSKDTTRDAMLGQGVYLTSPPPWTDGKKIVMNNWDGQSESVFLDKLDHINYFIAFDSRYLHFVRKASGPRDVWMVPYDIDLDKVPHSIHMRGSNVTVAESLGYL
ncbi:hypothetical protein L798_04620 [Zootermopsis nevadensis]|uniref:Tox-ART-HYD1 domain-containing protein n=1 Tax=Zootermopsis nevadensis TaxID=136037 RepID=A0A067QFN3_ZOONE|nr:hypothetical protein L798_04620 [Zootermopsis nevadensis]